MSILLGGWSWATVVVAFGCLPLLDAFIPPDTRDLQVNTTWIWDIPVFGFILAELGVLILVIQHLTSTHLSAWDISGYILGLGIVTGAGGITVAHELMHRSSIWARGIAEGLMLLVIYPHFCIEHVHGHHRRVATPEDPATARLGESLWWFLPRSIIGGALSAWQLETQRMKERVYCPWADRRLRQLILVVALGLGIGSVWGVAGVLVWMGQGVVAVILLETINYVEHYGLTRMRNENGRYERVQPHHSWNSPHRISNWHLLNLARHSDHHFLASRTYPELRHHPDAPQLPAGYPTMTLIALIPPLWRSIMDPRVDRYSKRPLN